MIENERISAASRLFNENSGRKSPEFELKPYLIKISHEMLRAMRALKLTNERASPLTSHALSENFMTLKASTALVTMRAWPVARSIFDAPLCERSEQADNKLDNCLSDCTDRHAPVIRLSCPKKFDFQP